MQRYTACSSRYSEQQKPRPDRKLEAASRASWMVRQCRRGCLRPNHPPKCGSIGLGGTFFCISLGGPTFSQSEGRRSRSGFSLSCEPHHRTTRTVANSVGANSSIGPPPLLVADFGRLLPTHKSLTSISGLTVCRLWGLFVGSYSTSAYARWAGRRGTGWPARSGFTDRGGQRSRAAGRVPAPSAQIHWGLGISDPNRMRLLSRSTCTASRRP
jgi:hypothetical protein